MSDPSDDDMDKPLTKREALELFFTKREALELFLTKAEFHDVMKSLFDYLDKKFDAIDKKFDAIDTKFDAIDKKFDHIDTKFDHIDTTVATKDWISAELARHTGAVDERHRTELSVVDDKYKDLPDRVTKLEAAVFPAPPAKRQRRR